MFRPLDRRLVSFRGKTWWIRMKMLLRSSVSILYLSEPIGEKALSILWLKNWMKAIYSLSTNLSLGSFSLCLCFSLGLLWWKHEQRRGGWTNTNTSQHTHTHSKPQNERSNKTPMEKFLQINGYLWIIWLQWLNSSHSDWNFYCKLFGIDEIFLLLIIFSLEFSLDAHNKRSSGFNNVSYD